MNSPTNILSNHVEEELKTASLAAVNSLRSGLSDDYAVGELLGLDFQEAKVLIHDYAKQKVQGLPHGSFLVATRIPTCSEKNSSGVSGLVESGIDGADDEDASLLLLRIIGEYSLPNSSQSEEYRFQAGVRATDSSDTWDSSDHIDEWTRNALHYGGYRCRVLGTFRMKKSEGEGYKLHFGPDLINYYSGRGMKVYKPVGALLSQIVNYRNSQGTTDEDLPVRVGRVRYAASEISPRPDLDGVPVELNPNNFVARRTFYGGMSRGGKSNAMKISARAIYLLRNHDSSKRIGQLIFDPNGEYANENSQNAAIRNLYKEVPGALVSDEVSVYGLIERADDPDRKIVKVNFFGDNVTTWSSVDSVSRDLEQLFVGKDLIESALKEETGIYVKSFRDADLSPPQDLSDRGEQTRYQRLITVYRGALAAAGFKRPKPEVNIKRLFSKAICDAMASTGLDTARDTEKKQKIETAAGILRKDSIPWDDFRTALEGLFTFIETPGSGWDAFDTEYRANSRTGQSWADQRLRDVLQIFKYSNGVRRLSPLTKDHSTSTTGDYAKAIAQDLRAGKLVIFDQSVGDQEQNTKAAERILWSIFNEQKSDFTNPRFVDGKLVPPPDVMVYLEEAHNLLPAVGKADELKSIWARTAKEGSKYRIGMVLATQEPSSVMPAILKNTDNWFVAHLNNSDEIRTLSKFYDFEDYAHQIKTVAEPGFVRMRTLSSPFTIPVQIDLFQIEGDV
ncbi:helicase HerA domain-containing protein [Vreelandella massiliensis]|uniref:helicase HerA domain-containing protein n=1 Tax=Vreelandella massiliensis TaxID=1816686 RepID=UPI0009F86F1F|nr:DUF87 domain-containing protein [Halomonas massiliensis]